MKKIYIIVLSSFGLLSCSDKFLEKDPLGQESNRTFYRSEDNCEQAVNAIYDPAGWYELYSINYPAIGDFCSDDSEKGGSGVSDQPELQAYETFSTNSSNAYLSTMWRGFYIGIARANEMLFRTDEVDFSEDLRLRYRAEARFMRALYYFDLVKVFGAVPLVTIPVNPGEGAGIGNRDSGSTAADQKQFILNFIVSELEDIKDDLPESYDANNYGRVTTYAAYGLLTRAYVWTSQWNNALTASNFVISKFPSLDVKYQEIFSYTNEQNDEILFSVQFTSGGDYGRNAEGGERSTYQNVRSLQKKPGTEEFLAGRGYGFNTPRKELVSQFDPLDPRLDMIVGVGDSIWWDFDPANIKKYPIVFPSGHTGHYCRKAVLECTQFSVAKDQSSGLDYPLIRLADVYLLAAEAAFHVGDAPKATQLVNKVRERARNSARKELGFLSFEYSTSSQPAGLPSVELADIYNERRLELYCEGHRFFDLVRTGQAESILSNITVDARGSSRKFTAGKNEVMPIPSSEIVRHSGGNLIQNSGY